MAVTVITSEEARVWCEGRGVAVNVRGLDASRLNLASLQFAIPEDAGARIALCRILYPDTWKIAGPALIWTTEWSVWPSGEHLPLIQRLRQAFGEHSSLEEARGYIMDDDSADDGQSILILHALFLWDCWLVSDTGDYATPLEPR